MVKDSSKNSEGFPLSGGVKQGWAGETYYVRSSNAFARWQHKLELIADSGSKFKIIRQVAALSRAHGGVSCAFLFLDVFVSNKMQTIWKRRLSYCGYVVQMSEKWQQSTLLYGHSRGIDQWIYLNSSLPVRQMSIELTRPSYICTVWVKKIPPEVFWHFPQTVGNF